MRAIFLPMLFLLCVFGCHQSHRQIMSSPTVGSTNGDIVYQSVTVCFRDHEVTVFSSEHALAEKITVNYQKRAVRPLNETFAKAANLGSLENRWLLAYLNHSALLYAQGKNADATAEIIPATPFTRDESWSLVDSRDQNQPIYWCRQSLALRRGEEIIAFADGDPAPPACEWVALTADSYYEWYRNLQDKIGLDEIFGESR